MTRRQAAQAAREWLYYVCEDPRVFFDFDAWLPGEQDYEHERDRMLDAFYALQQEFARRSGRTRRTGETVG